MSARPPWTSPSLAATPDGSRPAFELKFAVAPAVALELEAWAAGQMQRDPHADPERGYLITSTYFDTPAFDVLRRTPGYDVHKYRARRYGTEPTVHLERKSKTDGRVWKYRGTMPMAEIAKPVGEWPVDWFASDVGGLKLSPVCGVTYRRSAYIGTGGIRLTLDREAWGVPHPHLALTPLTAGVPLLTDAVVVECKFLASLPPLFKEAVEKFKLQPTGISKYRRCVRAAGLCADAEGTTDV